MSWEDIDRQIEFDALAWRENTRRMAAQAMRAVDDILYPKRAALRRALRAEFVRRQMNLDEIHALAVQLKRMSER